jgi:hypothetical protein
MLSAACVPRKKGRYRRAFCIDLKTRLPRQHTGFVLCRLFFSGPADFGLPVFRSIQLPIRIPLLQEAANLSRMRSPITSRSNLANERAGRGGTCGKRCFGPTFRVEG